MMTFGGHLEVLRRMLMRSAAVALCAAVCAFMCKETAFRLVLAPSGPDFITFRLVERVLRLFDDGYRFAPFHIDLIATEVGSQFAAHISVAVGLGLLAVSPYVVWQLFGFIAPALTRRESRVATPLLLASCVLFALGVLLTYFVLFPLSYRFLGTYSVAEQVRSQITIDSYLSLFATLSLMMGVVFQLPLVAWGLARLGVVSGAMMAAYRRHAVVGIMLLAAIITPPDVLTLLLVSAPLCLLYELSIVVARSTAGK